jgi:polyhydroxyalkanoate synthase subunit PhaC
MPAGRHPEQQVTARANPPGPLHRRGPRPLLLHLTLAMTRSAVSSGAWPSWSAIWPQRTAAATAPPLARLAELLKRDGSATEGQFAQAVLAETWTQDRALLKGIAAYRRHPYSRAMPEPPTLWHEGSSRLLDYAPGAGGPIILFVPSLINRSYILDLMENRSVLRWFAAAGMRPLLLDWGAPGALENSFTLTDYVAGRLERVLGSLEEPVILAGYCMGGLLTLAAAVRRPDRVRGLALLATPWDFHAPDADRARNLAAQLPALEPAMAVTGNLSTDLLQLLFACLDPFDVTRKYRAFGRLEQSGAGATMFVAIEDWLNDGIPLAAPVARECLGGWYGENLPARGAWRIAGAPIEPAAWKGPSFVAIPERDRIVPPESAISLATALKSAAVHRPAAGHVGMAAGSRAESELWRPLRDWCASI